MKAIDILKKIMAKRLAETSLGVSIHRIVESEDKLNSWANTALEHMIKLEVVKDHRYRKVWLDTVRKSFINMEKNSWISSQKKERLQKALMNKLKEFDKLYNVARVEFNIKLIQNQSPIPKEYTAEQRIAIVAKWKMCIDHYLSGDLDFFNNLNSHLE